MLPARHPNDRRRLGPLHWDLPGDGAVVDGYQHGGVPWPVETSRFAYETPFGGASEDVQPGQLGLNRQALQENTELVEGDRVVITVRGSGRRVPYMFRQDYEVVALDFARPEGFLQSVEGEAVLSCDEPEVMNDRLGPLDPGVHFILNGVLGRASS